MYDEIMKGALTLLENQYLSEENFVNNFIPNLSIDIGDKFTNVNGDLVIDMLQSNKGQLLNLKAVDTDGILNTYSKYLRFIDKLHRTPELYTNWYPIIIQKYYNGVLPKYVADGINCMMPEIVLKGGTDYTLKSTQFDKMLFNAKIYLGNKIIMSNIDYSIPIKDIPLYSEATYNKPKIVSRDFISNVLVPYTIKLEKIINLKISQLESAIKDVRSSYEAAMNLVNAIKDYDPPIDMIKWSIKASKRYTKLMKEYSHALSYIGVMFHKEAYCITTNVKNMVELADQMNNIMSNPNAQVVEEIEYYKDNLSINSIIESYESLLPVIRQCEYNDPDSDSFFNESYEGINDRPIKRLMAINDKLSLLYESFMSDSNYGKPLSVILEDHVGFDNFDRLLTEDINLSTYKSFDFPSYANSISNMVSIMEDINTMMDKMSNTNELELIDYVEEYVKPRYEVLQSDTFEKLCNGLIDKVGDRLISNYKYAYTEDIDITPFDKTLYEARVNELESNHIRKIQNTVFKRLVEDNLYESGYSNEFIESFFNGITEDTDTQTTNTNQPTTQTTTTQNTTNTTTTPQTNTTNTTDNKVDDAKNSNTTTPKLIKDEGAEEKKSEASGGWFKRMIDKISAFISGIIEKFKNDKAVIIDAEKIAEIRNALPKVDYNKLHLVVTDYESKLSGDEVFNMLSDIDRVNTTSITGAINRSDANLKTVLLVAFPFLTRAGNKMDALANLDANSNIGEEVNKVVIGMFDEYSKDAERIELTGQALSDYANSGINYVEKYNKVGNTLSSIRTKITQWSNNINESEKSVFDKNENGQELCKNFTSAYPYVVNALMNYARVRENNIITSLDLITDGIIRNNEEEDDNTTTQNTDDTNKTEQ